MRLVHRSSERRVIYLESEADLWPLFNVLTVGDMVTAMTSRKVPAHAGSRGREGGGSEATHSIRIRLSVKITKPLEFDDGELRCSGVTVEQHERVPRGSAHTMTVHAKMQVGVDKPEGAPWTAFDNETLDNACSVARNAVASVLLIDSGVARVFACSQSLQKLTASVNVPIPKARRLVSHDQCRAKFFETVFEKLREEHVVDWDTCARLIVAGPGFWKDEFLRFAMAYDGNTKRGGEGGGGGGKKNKQHGGGSTHAKSPDTAEGLAPASSGTPAEFWKAHGKKFVTAFAPGAYRAALTSKQVEEKLAAPCDDRGREAMDEIDKRLRSRPGCVCYGPKIVKRSVEVQMCSSVIISTTLLVARDAAVRKAWSDWAQNCGAEVIRCEAEQGAGQRLAGLGGVAALLKGHWEEGLNMNSSESESSCDEDEQ